MYRHGICNSLHPDSPPAVRTPCKHLIPIRGELGVSIRGPRAGRKKNSLTEARSHREFQSAARVRGETGHESGLKMQQQADRGLFIQKWMCDLLLFALLPGNEHDLSRRIVHLNGT